MNAAITSLFHAAPRWPEVPELTSDLPQLPRRFCGARAGQRDHSVRLAGAISSRVFVRVAVARPDVTVPRFWAAIPEPADS